MSVPKIPGYRIETLIGKGACGTVYAARHESGALIAVKLLDEESCNPGVIANQVSRLYRSECPAGALPLVAHSLTKAPYLMLGALEADHLEQEISDGRFDPVSFRMAYGRKTLLHEARSAAAVDVLLKHGSGLEILDAWKSTPLLAALGNNRPEVARALTKHGANTEVRTSTGKSVEEMWKWFDSN